MKPLIYSSDAAFNQSLGNLGGALGKALGAYNQPKKIDPISRLEIFDLGKKLGYNLDFYTTEMLDDVYKKSLQYQNVLPKDLALNQAFKDIAEKDYSANSQNASALNGAIGQNQQQSAPSIINQYKNLTAKQLKDSPLQSLLSNNENDSLISSLSSAVTGNAFSNFGDKSTDSSDSFAGVIKKGLSTGIASKSRAASQGITYDEFKKQNALKGSPSFAKKITYDLSNLIADAPFIGYGALLGSPGGPIGAAAGAGAFPTLIHSSLDEYMKYADKGGKASYGEFLQSSVNVAGKTGVAAATSSLMGIVGKLGVPLNKIPGLKNILNIKGGKTAQQVLNTATQAGVLTAASGVANQEFPSSQDYISNLTKLLGFKLFDSSKAAASFYSNAKKAGVSPQQAASVIQNGIQQQGLNPNIPANLKQIQTLVQTSSQPSGGAPSQRQIALQNALARKQQPQQQIQSTMVEAQSTPSEQRLLPVSKARSPKTPKEVKGLIKKVQTTEKGVYAQDKEAVSPSTVAKRLAERPVKEYIESDIEKQAERAMPFTPGQQIISDNAKSKIDLLDKKISSIKSDIQAINSKLIDKTLSKKEESNQLFRKKELKDSLSKLESDKSIYNAVVATGKDRQTLDTVEKQAASRVDRLLEEVVQPKSISAEKTAKDFARDQKYENELAELIKKGEIPAKKLSDYRIKTLKAYQDKYQTQLGKVTENLLTAPKNEIPVLTAYKNLLEKNIAINDAKIKVHQDKINSLKNLEGASGALIKQNLKDLRKDISSIQQDFVKVSKMQSAIEKKTQEKALGILSSKKGEKALIDAVEKGSIKEVSELSAIPVKEVESIKEQAQNFINDKIKTEYKIPEDTSMGLGGASDSSSSAFKNFFNKFTPRHRKVAQAFALSAIKIALKKLYGIPGGALTLKGLGIGSITALYNYFERMYKRSQDKKYADQIRNARSDNEKQKIIKDLESSDYSTARINRIKKAVLKK